MNALLGITAALAISWVLLGFIAVPIAKRAALSVVAGLAVFSAVGALQFLWHVPTTAADGCLLAAALALKLTGRTSASASAPRTWSRRWSLLFAAAALLALCALLEHLHRYPDGGADAYIIWNLRARWLARAVGDVRSAFSSEILYWAHPDYPLMLPSIVARAFRLVGNETAVIPALVAVVFAASAVAVVVTAAPHGRGYIAGLALVTTPALVMLAATEQADVPLAAFLVAAVAVLVERKPGDDLAFVAAGAFASMAAWTKNEGAALLLLTFVAVVLDARRVKPALLFALGAAPFVALLAAFKLDYAPPNDLLQSSLAGMLHNLTDPRRWFALVALVPRRVVLLQVWGLHLVALLAYLLLVVRIERRKRTRWLAWVPAVWMLCSLLLLIIQPYDVTWMFKVTIDRLLIEVWPFTILMAVASEIHDVGDDLTGRVDLG